MKNVVLAASAVGLLALAAMPATAGTSSTYEGGCSVAASTRPSQLGGEPDELHGAINALTITHSSEPGDNPVTAAVRCELRIDDAVYELDSAWVAMMTGPVVQRGQRLFEAPFTPTSTAEICTIVDYLSDDTPTDVDCVPFALS